MTIEIIKLLIVLSLSQFLNGKDLNKIQEFVKVCEKLYSIQCVYNPRVILVDEG